MTELIDFECYNKDMKNTHLEHPEDAVLLGRESTRQVLDFLREKNSKVSVKWDGAPAFVFGHNPENGKRFVGTKSVFNKRKIKINHNHHEIEENHGDNPRVAAILHTCFECLPDRAGVWQGGPLGNASFCLSIWDWMFALSWSAIVGSVSRLRRWSCCCGVSHMSAGSVLRLA